MIFFYLSGGIGAAHALRHLLTKTDIPIHAHHCIVKDGSGNWRPEMAAAQYTAKYLRRTTRPFELSFATVDHGLDDRRRTIVDWSTTGSARIANQGADDVQAVCAGFTRPDARQAEIELLQTLHRVNTGSELPAIFPNDGLDKADMFASLPRTLQRSVWSCATPDLLRNNSFRPCGQCASCREMEDVRRKVPAAV